MNSITSIKRNIYKIDDIFLIVSWIILAVLIIRFLVFIPNLLGVIVLDDPIRGRPYIFLGVLFSSFLFLHITGRLVQKKERRLQKVIDIILHYRSISIANLSRISGIPGGQLDDDLAEVEKHSRPHIAVQGDQILLRIGEKVRVSYICPSCGASSAGDIYINSPLLTCAYCATPLEDNEVRALREKILERAQEASKSMQQEKPLNIPLLIILFMFFWPGAILYLVKYSMNKNKNNVLFDEVRKNFELS